MPLLPPAPPRGQPSLPPLPKVRTLAAKLLAVLDQFKAAKPCVSGLNTFLLLGYDCAREGAS